MKNLTKTQRAERDAWLTRFRNHSLPAVIRWFDLLSDDQKNEPGRLAAFWAYCRYMTPYGGGRGRHPKILTGR